MVLAKLDGYLKKNEIRFLSPTLAQTQLKVCQRS